MNKGTGEFDGEKQASLPRRLHVHLVDAAAAIVIAHDLNPRALSPKVKGFVQAQSWMQDPTPISLG